MPLTDKKPPNVLIVDNSNDLTGAFKSISGMTVALKEEFNFFYCLPENSTLANELRLANKQVITLPFLEIQKSVRIILYLPTLIYNTIRITNFCKKNQIEILHINDLYNMCGVLAKMFNPTIRVIYHVRLMRNSYVRAMYTFFSKRIAKRADAVIAVSEAVRKDLSDLGIESTLIYDALSVQEKYPSRNIDGGNGPITLLYLANYTPGKGHAYAMDAFSLAQKQIRDLKMIMAGGDLRLEKNIQLKIDLKKAASNLELTDRIVFYDYVNDVEKLMKSSDMVLNFSESESFSFTCLEALTYGTPLIATDSGGPKELFEHGKSGLLVPNRDIQAMAKAIVQLCSDLQLRKSFSIAGKKYVQEKFSAEKSSQTLRSLYTQVNH